MHNRILWISMGSAFGAMAVMAIVKHFFDLNWIGTGILIIVMAALAGIITNFFDKRHKSNSSK
ncbi:hypothetical protein [Companilactobacillus mishanensis]|uniref:hypothetical protein n=1 Tax=Companilactobacillus mishanensis TaxID=2486008 RepID=UPI00129638CE|nr:hypothetical protein [Companilactobacillus mishanensis]MQS89844.1 hypothetical protein [Companilactobacillus mishanensis]